MDILNELRERIRRDDAIVFALLFGSRARGTHRPNSDWDVAVYLQPTLSAEERFRHRIQLAADLDDLGAIDIVILNEAPALLAHRALQGCKLFSRNDAEYAHFFVRALGQSGDEAYWRGIHRRARAKRLEESRFGRP